MKKNHYGLISGVLCKIWRSKFLKRMRIVVLLFVITVTQTFAIDSYGQSKRLSINFENETIINILENIEDQSEFYFMFDASRINVNQRKSVNCENQSISNILDQLFKDTGIIYSIKDRQVLLATEKSDTKQPKAISGKVTDISEQPLPGVTVVVKGTTLGTVTNADGEYSLTNIPDNAILQFSFVGMKTQEILIAGKSSIDVTMAEDAIGIEEVVAIGYGSAKKSDITGAIGAIKSESITRSNPVQSARALQGQVAGVNVARVNSQPGAEYSIDIRGLSSINNSNEPLVVIDGIMGGDLNTLNPTDIETMDVLKDASATAIYGSRGANGVIIITTKKGVEGKMKVTYDGYAGVKVPSHLPKMMSAQQFYKAYTSDKLLDGGAASTFTSTEVAMVESGNSTNWVDEVTKPGLQTSHVIAVSGGSANSTYYFSTGYLKESGNLINTNYNRYNIKGSMDSKLGKLLKVGFSAYYTYSVQNLGSNEAIRSAYRARPTGVVNYSDVLNTDENNEVDWNGYAVWMGINDAQVLNPLVEGASENFKHETRASNLLANSYVELSPFKGLSIRSSLSALVYNDRIGEYRGTYTKSQKASKDPKASYTTDNRSSYTWDNILSYKTDLNRHKIGFTAVQSAFMEREESSKIEVEDLPYESIWYSLGTAETITGVSSSLTERTLLSYMGRFNYSFDDKYLLTVTGRWDGASVLAEGHKWAFFPSAALAWRLNEELFIKNLNLFSNLKARISYGLVGNDNVEPYSTQANLLNTAYDFGGSSAYGFAPEAIANEDLSWEKSREINLGFDLGFIDNRISASIELYNRKTVDLILDQQLPTSTGFDEVTANVGKVLNKGIEITLNTVNIHKHNFTWNTNINFSSNHNEILELYGGGITVDKGNNLFVGESLNSNFYYEFDGIWQLDEADEAEVYGQDPGSVKVVDQDNDGTISSADDGDDRIVLGSELPKWLAGLTNTLTYKNWDFSFFVYTRQGVQYKNGLLSGTFGELTSGRYNHLDLNYWTPENPTNDYFGLTASQPYRQAIQYQDASFIRISDITLGYSFPQTLLSKWNMSKFRVYGQVNNPFVFTKFVSLDPEYNSSTYADNVPSTTFLFGVNMSF